MSHLRKKTNLISIVSLLIASLAWASPTLAAIYYVKSGNHNGNGTSWGKAFNNLDSALEAARNNSSADQIWIAAGTYKPSVMYAGTYGGSEPNLKTFNLPSDVALFGGFKGTEKKLGDRNGNKYPTILSGDLEGNDINTPTTTNSNKTDNAWHVLTADGVTGVSLDTLIVQDGYAAGPDDGTLGPKFTLATLDYTHDAGGGLHASHGSKVSLNNIHFKYNACDSTYATMRGPNQLGSPALASGGGAIRSEDEGTIVKVKHSSFIHNTAFNSGGNGGALSAALEGSFDISYSSFINNIGNRNGGAIHGKDAEHITLYASFLKDNKVTGTIPDASGGAIGLINTNLTVSTSVFENNTSGPIAGGGGIIFQVPFDDGEAYVLKVDKSTFNGNHGAAFGGGAILILGATPHPGTTASISRSVFRDNTGGIGGALYIDSIPTKLTKSIFINNKAWVNGGAIFASNFGDAIFGITNIADRTVLDISKSIFKGNTIIGIPEGAPITPTQLANLVANFQSAVNEIDPAGVNKLTPGGGAIAVELGGNVSITKSAFYNNSAPDGYGGALLVGGSEGFSGTTNLGMNQAFSTLTKSYCSGNTATLGGDNTYVLDPVNLGNKPNGVQLDGGC